MNEFAGFTKPVIGGHRAMLRFVKDGHPKPIMEGGERSKVFPTEIEALRAVNCHLLPYFNGSYGRVSASFGAAGNASTTSNRRGDD